jgi:hypothetical protein
LEAIGPCDRPSLQHPPSATSRLQSACSARRVTPQAPAPAPMSRAPMDICVLRQVVMGRSPQEARTRTLYRAGCWVLGARCRNDLTLANFLLEEAGTRQRFAHVSTSTHPSTVV